MNLDDVINHYDALITEGIDLVNDPPVLRGYMNTWDGPIFIDELHLDESKSVLEIGVGTGRLARQMIPFCSEFTGIDISPKTIECARENLTSSSKLKLICDDFLQYPFNELFDIVYSSLTFMHIQDKMEAFRKVAKILKPNGRFVLSIDKNQSEYIDYGTRKVLVYPDKVDDIKRIVSGTSIEISKIIEIENAYIFVCVNQNNYNQINKKIGANYEPC